MLFYGHVETAGGAHRAPAAASAQIQSATRGGFTEFVPIPLPGPYGGVPLVPGRAPIDEHRAMVAVSRLMLSGSIPHIQMPWTRSAASRAAVLLRPGGDDLGGTLLDGRVKPRVGVEHGLELPSRMPRRIAARLFRPFRLRTTDYRDAGPGGAPDRSGPVTRVEVAIVGAGFAGLGMAMALRASGRQSFIVLERARAVGGTWRDNTYPGVACDVPSHLYGFADHPNPRLVGRCTPRATRSAPTSSGSPSSRASTRRRSTPACCSAEWDASADHWHLRYRRAATPT